MKITQGDTLEWKRGLEYRGGTFHFRSLMEGEEGSVDNFRLGMGKSSADFYSPRHRHNFEQIRFVLDGELSFGRDGTMTPGMPAAPSGSGISMRLMSSQCCRTVAPAVAAIPRATR